MEHIAGLNPEGNENRNRIFHCIRQNKIISRPAIARELELSLPTVTTYLQELEDNGMIYKNGSLGNTGGRRAAGYSVVRDKYIAAGIDLTETYLMVTLVDLNGDVLRSEKKECVFSNDAAYWNGAKDFVDSVLEQCGRQDTVVLGIGIAVQAIVTQDHSGIFYVKTMDIDNLTSKMLEDYFQYPCLLFNDANAAGYGEIFRRPEADNLFYIGLSDNVGGSILIDNKPFGGQLSKSGEIGHITVQPEGKQCYCGQRGCLDAYCSASVLKRTLNVSIAGFFAGLAEGNEQYQEYWEEYMDMLAIAVADIRILFDCEIVLGGYIGSRMETYLPEIRKRAAARNPFEDNADYLTTCSVKEEALSYGSALYLVHQFWEKI